MAYIIFIVWISNIFISGEEIQFITTGFELYL